MTKRERPKRKKKPPKARSPAERPHFLAKMVKK